MVTVLLIEKIQIFRSFGPLMEDHSRDKVQCMI